jgi:hypothetical protein
MLRNPFSQLVITGRDEDQLAACMEKKMIRIFVKQFLSMTLSMLMVVTAVPSEAEAQQSAAPAGSGQGAPLTAEELQQLTGPIALYPDALVAQILGGATFPDQISSAAKWVHDSNLTGTPLMQAVDKQTWDPSVKALTQFLSVLAVEESASG